MGTIPLLSIQLVPRTNNRKKCLATSCSPLNRSIADWTSDIESTSAVARSVLYILSRRPTKYRAAKVHKQVRSTSSNHSRQWCRPIVLKSRSDGIDYAVVCFMSVLINYVSVWTK